MGERCLAMTKKGASVDHHEGMNMRKKGWNQVPSARIELTTSSLLVTRSTTELGRL